MEPYDLGRNAEYGRLLDYAVMQRQVREQVRGVLDSTDSRTTKVERVADLIRHAGAYRWVGIYAVEGDEIPL